MKNTYRPAYRDFLERLQKARVDAGLTQLDVARKLRRDQTFVSKFESGRRRLDFIEVVELAKLYRKPLSYFHG